MNNFLTFSTNTQIANALVLIVVLLVYIAYQLSQKPSSRSRKALSR